MSKELRKKIRESIAKLEKEKAEVLVKIDLASKDIFLEMMTKLGKDFKVQIIGYTPSWNDGDPCTHRSKLRLIHMPTGRSASDSEGFYEEDFKTKALLKFVEKAYDCFSEYEDDLYLYEREYLKSVRKTNYCATLILNDSEQLSIVIDHFEPEY